LQDLSISANYLRNSGLWVWDDERGPCATWSKGRSAAEPWLWQRRQLAIDDSQIVFEWAQFAVEAMLGVIHFQAILDDESCFLDGGARIRMLVEVV